MKKLFGMIAIVLLFSSVVFAEIIEKESIVLALGTSHGVEIKIVCIDGYKFVVADRGNVEGNLRLIQFYEFEYGKTVPAKC